MEIKTIHRIDQNVTGEPSDVQRIVRQYFGNFHVAKSWKPRRNICVLNINDLPKIK